MSTEGPGNSRFREPKKRRSAVRVLAQGGLAGLGAVFVGFVLGMGSYDHRFITDTGDPTWELVGDLSYLFITFGLLSIGVAIAGIPLALVARALWGLRGRVG